MFSVHTTPEEFKTQQRNSHIGFAFEENLSQRIHIRPLESEKPVFSNSVSLKSVFGSKSSVFRRDRLVWTVGLSALLK